MIKKQLILIICIAFLFAPNLWAAQVAIVQTDTRQEAWAKETLNNTDLQTNIDAKISDTVYGIGWNGDTSIGASKNAIYDKIESIVAGTTDINDIGDATAAGAVDFVTYLQQWDVGSGNWQVGDGGSNYVQFSTSGMTFGGTYTLSANIVSDYITFTPSATTPATTDGLLRNVTGLTGLGDTFGFYDGAGAQYFVNYEVSGLTAGDLLIYNATDDEWDHVTVSGDMTINESGVAALAQSAIVVNTLGNFTTPITTNPYTLTAANSYNASLFYGATGEVDLPAMVDGMAIAIYNTGAFTITIDPNGSEVIVREGTAQTGGVSMTLSSGAGNYVCLVSNGTQWVTFGFIGTLAAGS
jgi:hypothetical protein